MENKMNSFESLSKFTYVSLIFAQIVVLVLKYFNVDIFGVDFGNLSYVWTFSPIMAFAVLKWGYWISDTLYSFFVVILRVALVVFIAYIFYWVFFS